MRISFFWSDYFHKGELGAWNEIYLGGLPGKPGDPCAPGRPGLPGLPCGPSGPGGPGKQQPKDRIGFNLNESTTARLVTQADSLKELQLKSCKSLLLQ